MTENTVKNKQLRWLSFLFFCFQTFQVRILFRSFSTRPNKWKNNNNKKEPKWKKKKKKRAAAILHRRSINGRDAAAFRPFSFFVFFFSFSFFFFADFLGWFYFIAGRHQIGTAVFILRLFAASWSTSTFALVSALSMRSALFKIRLGFHRVVSIRFIGFYQVVPGFHGFYRVLPGFTGFKLGFHVFN